MNRPIKFRVWDTQTKRYLYQAEYIATQYGYLMHDHPYKLCLNYPDTHIDFTPEEAYVDYHRQRLVMEQFTGLLDKDGKEIYEGDIIRFSIHGVPHGRYREDNIVEPVWYSDEQAAFVFGKYVVPEETNQYGHKVGGYTWWYSMSDDVDKETLEVMGNVHQNPELVKAS